MKVMVHPVGELLEFADPEVSVREVARQAGLERRALAARVGGVYLGLDDLVRSDLATSGIVADGSERQVVGNNGSAATAEAGPEGTLTIQLLCDNQPDGLDVLRHSTAHVMADAVSRLFPGVKLAIGPTIRDGFYYDLDFSQCERRPTDEDLPLIEEEMRRIVDADHPFARQEMAADLALERVKAAGEQFKVEIIDQYRGQGVKSFSFYRHGDFEDLCRGPHVPSTGRIKAFRLLSIAGAYWRGIETNPMLVRIYGTAFFKDKELRIHLKRLDEARKRDHRRVGKDLDLFSFHPEAPGSPFWHPKGVVLFNQLLAYCREVYTRAGYDEVKAPLVLDESLWHRSGHWENFRENMYFTAPWQQSDDSDDERRHAIKPMNCPGHCLIYGNRLHSYRELPIRYAEYSPLHRNERSGALHGLTRVRSFSQDDAHIFCTLDQLEQEVRATIALQGSIYSDLGFNEWTVRLATRPERRVGTDEQWDRAEEVLAGCLEDAGLSYELAAGEGAFYGPKIEFHIVDCLQRSWQCGTVQVDFSMPQRFELEFVDSESARQTPVMVHRAILGSFERMIAMLIEQYAGAFPLWLAPEQVRVLPIGEAHVARACEVREELLKAGLRVDTDLGANRIGKKVAEATVAKVPYMAVIGDAEVESGQVALRHRKQRDVGKFTLESLKDRLRAEVEARAVGPVESQTDGEDV